MYTIKCNLANIFLVLPLGTIGGSADIATSGSTFIAPWAGFGKICPQGPLPLAPVGCPFHGHYRKGHLNHHTMGCVGRNDTNTRHLLYLST